MAYYEKLNLNYSGKNIVCNKVYLSNFKFCLESDLKRLKCISFIILNRSFLKVFSSLYIGADLELLNMALSFKVHG